jgi:hypothetical protein
MLTIQPTGAKWGVQCNTLIDCVTRNKAFEKNRYRSDVICDRIAKQLPTLEQTYEASD